MDVPAIDRQPGCAGVTGLHSCPDHSCTDIRDSSPSRHDPATLGTAHHLPVPISAAVRSLPRLQRRYSRKPSQRFRRATDRVLLLLSQNLIQISGGTLGSLPQLEHTGITGQPLAETRYSSQGAVACTRHPSTGSFLERLAHFSHWHIARPLPFRLGEADSRSPRRMIASVSPAVGPKRLRVKPVLCNLPKWCGPDGSDLPVGGLPGRPDARR